MATGLLCSGLLEGPGSLVVKPGGEACGYDLSQIIKEELTNPLVPGTFSLVEYAKRVAESCPDVKVTTLTEELEALGVGYTVARGAPVAMLSLDAIHVLRISFPGLPVSSAPGKHVVMVTGQHSREWPSQACLVKLTTSLLVHRMANDPVFPGCQFTIIPTVNPVGCLLSRVRGGMGRQKRELNGVDMNRNWAACWTKQEHRAGEFPGSLVEVDGLSRYFTSLFQVGGPATWFFDFHSFGRILSADPCVNLQYLRQNLRAAHLKGTTPLPLNYRDASWYTGPQHGAVITEQLEPAFKAYLEKLGQSRRTEDAFWANAAGLVLCHASDRGMAAHRFVEATTQQFLTCYTPTCDIEYYAWGALTDFIALHPHVAGSVLIETGPASAEFSTEGQEGTIITLTLNMLKCLSAGKSW